MEPARAFFIYPPSSRLWRDFDGLFADIKQRQTKKQGYLRKANSPE